MLKLLLIMATCMQLACISGQFQSLMNLNLNTVTQVAEDLFSALRRNSSLLPDVLGLSPGDPLASVSKLLELRQQYDIDTECLEHVFSFMQALSAREEWAIRMIDAVAKPPSGILQGKGNWLGDWDECTGIKAVVYQNATAREGPRQLFTGKYCHVDYGMGGSTLSIGVCLPNTCSSSDGKALAEILTSLVSPYMNKTLNFSLPNPSSVTCQEKLPWTTRAIAVMVVCSIFLFVMVLATLYDVLYIQPLSRKQVSEKKTPVNVHQNEAFRSDLSVNSKTDDAPMQNGKHIENHKTNVPNKLTHNGGSEITTNDLEGQREREHETSPASKLLLSFSMFTNGTKLLNTHQPQGALTAVNGIRFLSMSWVIVGHSFSFVSPYTDNAAPMYMDLTRRFSFMAILNGTFSVDTFFVLSGFLLTYLTMKELGKCKGARIFNWGLFYFHRLWRLTPPYMLILMIYVSLNVYWGNGPIWDPQGMERQDCKTWWMNLLYINNFQDLSKMCFGWSWYLANDMQFYVLSPLMLIPLFHLPVLGGIMCLLFLLTGIVSSGMVSHHYQLPPSFYFDPTGEKMQHYMADLYMKPWCRVGPYALGVFAGYLLYRCKSTLKIPKVVNWGAWLVATAAALLVVYGIYSEDGTNPLSMTMTTAYNAASRSIWGACIAWVIFACATGNGGPVNHILSWPGFVPLGRLSYCAYLVHPFMMNIYNQSIRTLVHGYDYSLIYLTLGNLCISYATAFVVSLAVEAPMMGMEKVLLGRAKSS